MRFFFRGGEASATRRRAFKNCVCDQRSANLTIVNNCKAVTKTRTRECARVSETSRGQASAKPALAARGMPSLSPLAGSPPESPADPHETFTPSPLPAARSLRWPAMSPSRRTTPSPLAATLDQSTPSSSRCGNATPSDPMRFLLEHFAEDQFHQTSVANGMHERLLKRNAGC